MRCPNCSISLVPRRYGALTLAQCPRCVGTFLESGQASATLGPGTEALDWINSPGVRRYRSLQAVCPHGHEPMHAYLLNAGNARTVAVDVCHRCQGIWLDLHEARLLQQAVQGMRTSEATLAVAGDAPEGEDRRGPGWYLFQLFSGLPVEVWNPVKVRPLVVHALMALLVIVFAGELLLASSDRLEAFIQEFGIVPTRVMQGATLWTLFTSMFLHGGWLHLFGNLYFLHLFGDNVEDRLGHVRFLVIYMVAGLAGALLHALVHAGSDTPAIGASGAIAGVMAAYLVLFPRVKLWLVLLFVRFKLNAWWYLLFWLGAQFLIGSFELARVVQTQIAVFDHIGGFLAGLILGMIYRRGGLGVAARDQAL
jgi:membrane associated rhomboid family serine protease/Zn-finger nucleic acid-binding protein